MLLLIFLALLLLFVQSLLPAKFLIDQVGLADKMGAPDTLPAPNAYVLRSRDALRNLQETLPMFLTLGVLTIVLDIQNWVSVLGGVIFLAGRVGQVVSHIRALSPWRSVSYTVALVGLILVAAPLVPHIWA